MRKLKLMNRLFSLFLALILVASTAVVSVSAAEGDYVYVLDRAKIDGSFYQYQSPYQVYYKFNGKTGYVTPVQVYKMQRLEAGAYTGEVILAYCMDININASLGADYRRMNLEDSPFSGSTAGQIRSILTHGFYLTHVADESDAAHQTRVDKKLAELRTKSGVADLTIGEALSATQAAIWQSSHGSALEFTSFLLKILNPIESTNVKYYEMCATELSNGHIEFGSSKYLPSTACETRINGRIKQVYDYLLSLDPIPAGEKAVSPSSFVKLHDPVMTDNGDDTYTVTVDVTVDVDMASGDNLTLRARLDDKYSQNVSLSDGEQTIKLTINNVPAEDINGDVKLSISGEQTVSGYFYFDANGDRSASQSMVGYSNSRLPVYAEVTAQENRVLNIEKTTIIDGSSEPLEGIVFDIFPVATMEEYQTGEVKLPENPADYKYSTLAEYTLITDANGRASLDFTHHGLPDSIYLVVERNHPNIVAPIEPFYLSVPTNNAASGDYIYSVTIRPKNEVKASIKIEKDVITIGNNKATVDAYTPHTWIISTSIPVDISNGKSYVISDTMDNRLDYVGNLKVVLETMDGSNKVALVADEDYTLSVTDEDSLAEGKPSDEFAVTLTSGGMSKIATTIGSNDYSNYKLRVYFDARINANAEMGAEIPNKASVEYINNVNLKLRKESDVPVVYTGGVNLLKVDSADATKMLAGATFEVYRIATAEEINAGGEDLKTFPDRAAPLIKVSFFSNAKLDGDKVTSVTTGEDGKIAIYGLAYGMYYLVETKAPAGYNLMAGPKDLVIDAASHKTENTITVENKMGALLPSTGGVGTTIFTVSGIGLVCIACLFLYMNKRKLIET